MDLVIIVVISLLVVPLVVFTSGVVRVILGLALVLFFPGYTLLSALFPRRSSLNNSERIALSFGLSLAIVPLIGIVVHLIWGIKLYSALGSLLAFITLMAVIAWYRRRSLAPGERFQPQISPSLSSFTQWWRLQTQWDKALTVMLAVAIVAPVGTITYLIAQPKLGVKLTEFYILGLEGKADGYPYEFGLKEGKVAWAKYVYADPNRIPQIEAAGKVIVGVANQERQTMDYQVEITIEGEKMGEDIAPFTLPPGERWRQEVVLIPTKIGSPQKVEFRLYKGGGAEPYRTLEHWIEVKEE